MNQLTFSPPSQGSPPEPGLCQTSPISQCPNRSCPYFDNPPQRDSWYWYHGKYTTLVIGTVNRDRLQFHHVQISSREARNTTNPLFPVNYVDRQFHKDQTNHVRETVQFALCPQAMMTRLTLYMGYHNYISPYRIRKYRAGDRRSRAQWQGLSAEMIIQTFQKYWSRRVFFHRVKLWAEEEKTWKRQWRNPGVDFGRYVPKYIAV